MPQVVKKHDKRSHLQLRSSLSAYITGQPFYTSRQLATTLVMMQRLVNELLNGAHKDLPACSSCGQTTALFVLSG